MTKHTYHYGIIILSWHDINISIIFYNDWEIECCALINTKLNMYQKEMEGVSYKTCKQKNMENDLFSCT